MHGRLKVKTTAEQQEAKRKEREKKLAMYKAANETILAKREKNELDQELLNISGELLSSNPDYYTLWNIRREVFELWLTTRSSEELQKSLNAELYFLEQCLMVNPKSYGTWHQRCWVLGKMPEPNWKRELFLCSKFLDIDERNFHCWDYRRFIVRKFGVLPEDELEFATSKISSNFSNFSSWHYRSKLLPIVHPDDTQPMGVKEDVIQQEFDLVQNAFFTDPSDQSAWFYHKWLLGKEQKELSIEQACVNRKESVVLITFNRYVRLGVDCTVELTVDNEKVDAQWVSSGGSSAILWMTPIKDVLLDEAEHSVLISFCGPTENLSENKVLLHLEKNVDDCRWVKNHVAGTLFSREFNAATSDILSQEIESCKQLHELEPDNKWVILTLLSLMRALEPMRHLPEVVSYLEKLVVLDPMRTNYYCDLRSRILMEDALESALLGSCQSFSLPAKQLTAAYHLEHLVCMTHVDLSQNALLHLKSGHLLQSAQKLDLSGNRLRSCHGIERLPRLEQLDLSHNEIQEIQELVFLKSCPNLMTLVLSGNPVADIPDVKDKIRQFLPSVVHVL